ncbi:hypothetical protein FOCC_FOCC005867 [Frankliniella occidentalis]|nr:hypothetical protein FOCC_FOCC005867 [Frankliniella occidentalis]
MDIDALTIGTTDYEDLMINDSADNMSSEARGLTAPLVGLAGGDGAGVQLAAYNYTSLESIVSEVWERRPGLPGVQLHEACVLLLSALVVGVHGLAGLLQSALSPHAVWALLHAGLVLGCLYALASMCMAVHAALCRRFILDDEEVVHGGVEDTGPRDIPTTCTFRPQDADEKAAPASAQEEEPPLESFVSAQLEKEERVQRWIDNLCATRDQVNLEACGEMEGRNMEAEKWVTVNEVNIVRI